MIFTKIFIFLVVLRCSHESESGRNVFLVKLNKLLDFVAVNRAVIDEQLMLGIFIASGQLRMMRRTFETDLMVKKCEAIEEMFVGRKCR
jgi:hypothetical protein